MNARIIVAVAYVQPGEVLEHEQEGWERWGRPSNGKQPMVMVAR